MQKKEFLHKNSFSRLYHHQNHHDYTVKIIFLPKSNLQTFTKYITDTYNENFKGPSQYSYMLLSFVNIGLIGYLNPTHFPPNSFIYEI